MGKGAKWTAKEDEALAEAWVEVSDPSSGVTITSDEFWEAVYAHWATLRAREGPARSEKAIKTRWQVLTHTVQRFEALLAQAAEQRPDEPRDVLYDVANKEFLREEGVLFDRKRVWAVLTSCSRWSSNPRSLRKLLRMRKAAVLDGDEEDPAEKRRKSLGAATGAAVVVVGSESSPSAAAQTDSQRLGRLAPALHARGEPGGPIAAFASSLQRLNGREQDDADAIDEQVTTVAAVEHQGGTSGAPAGPTSDAYAAAVADLARVQREKNELVADQMLMTMLLADTMDMRNRAALEQLKMKYLQRAFASDPRPSQV